MCTIERACQVGAGVLGVASAQEWLGILTNSPNIVELYCNLVMYTFVCGAENCKSYVTYLNKSPYRSEYTHTSATCV